MNGCEYQTYAGNLEQPAEYCENEAVEGEDLCEDHLPVEWCD